MRTLLGAATALLVMALLATAAHANGTAMPALRKNATMALKGEIEVGADGVPTAHRITDADKVPPGVQQLVAATVKTWRFEPVLDNGVPVAVRAPMSVSVLAEQREDGGYQVKVGDASFGTDKGMEDYFPRRKNMVRPPYPLRVAREGITGTVYVVARVGTDGRVVEAWPEQVDIMNRGSQLNLDPWRKRLAAAAIGAARDSTFIPPTAGELAGKPSDVRIPYRFEMERDESGYGQWSVYIPGPRHPAPWRNESVGDDDDDLRLTGQFKPLDGPTPRLQLLDEG